MHNGKLQLHNRLTEWIHAQNTQEDIVLSSESSGFRDFGDTCTGSSSTLRGPLCSMRAERQGGWRRREQERRGGQHHAGTELETEKRAVRDKQREFGSRHCHTFSRHDTAAQWFTFPQAILPEDARQPPETETTHPPRQRVQEPDAAGRHQRVRDRTRR